MRPTFVDKDELLRGELGRGLTPDCPRLLVAHGTAASVFVSASSPGGGSLATWSLHSAAARSAPPTRRSAPRRWHWEPLPAAPATPLPARVPWAAGSQEWACARVSRSRGLAPRRGSRCSRKRYSGERLLAWADPPPPLAPGVLSGRSSTHAYPRSLHNSCLPLLLASCSRVGGLV